MKMEGAQCDWERLELGRRTLGGSHSGAYVRSRPEKVKWGIMLCSLLNVSFSGKNVSLNTPDARNRISLLDAMTSQADVLNITPIGEQLYNEDHLAIVLRNPL